MTTALPNTIAVTTASHNTLAMPAPAGGNVADTPAPAGDNGADTPGVPAPAGGAVANASVPSGAVAAAVVATCLCSKCKLDQPLDGVEASPHFCCKKCNCKRSTLSQLFGHWPVEMFSLLPEACQTAFWQAPAKGKMEIQNALVKTVSDQRLVEEREVRGGKYLPLDAWERKGFDPKKIKAECKDTEEHDLLGTCYNIGLKSKTKEEIHRQVWKDLFTISGDCASKTKDDKKKKKKKKNKKGSSGSSSSSSHSSSSSDPKVSLVEQRRLDAAKRKAAAAEKKEEAKRAKLAEAAEEKAQLMRRKAAMDEAKEQHKAALATQTVYNNLWSAHAKLVTALHVVPMDKTDSEAVGAAEEKIAQGNSLIEEVLTSMKRKTEAPADEVKAYIKSLGAVNAALGKLLPKAKKQNR